MAKEGGAELFYVDANGERRDADLHDELLGGAHDGAEEIGRQAAKAAGLTDDEIEALFPPPPITPERRKFFAAKHRALAQDTWSESEHPRGQPENKGEFASKEGGSEATPAEKPDIRKNASSGNRRSR